MNVGIQPGTTAASLNSARLDSRIRQARKELLRENAFACFKHIAKLPKKQIPSGEGACQPDSGLVLLNNRYVLACEGKTQNEDGNACERYGKNRSILDTVVPSLAYVTLCAGPGAELGFPLHVLGTQVLAMETGDIEWNTYHRCGASFYKVDRLISVAQIKRILRPILFDIIENESLIIAIDQQLRENHAERQRIRRLAQVQVNIAA